MERLPLASVRTFAVVARFLSISRAAEELSVTPSAVSHQIRVLEEFLGVALFHRQKNRLKLTPAGERYMADASEALQLLARATRSVKTRRDEHVLRIGVPPSLAALWLVPRVSEFAKAQPDVALTITASTDPAYHLGTAFDVAISYGGGDIPGLTIDALGRNCMFPVCKPALRCGEQGLRSAADLRRYTLLDSSDASYYRYGGAAQPSWAEWLEVAGIDLNGAREMRLTPQVLVHNAAKAGVGVGLSRSLLAVDAIAAGDLAVPFGPVTPLQSTYNFVAPPQLLKRKEVAALREWLLAESAASHRQLDRLLKPLLAKKPATR